MSKKSKRGGAPTIEQLPQVDASTATQGELLAYLAVAFPELTFEEYDEGELREEVAAHQEQVAKEQQQAAPPVQRPAVAKDQSVTAEPVLASESDLAALDRLEKQVAAARSSAAAPKKPATGSKPRPNVVYTLLTKPPAWHSTPQVAQLEQILFGNTLGPDGTMKKELTEPELFELVTKGHAEGKLATKQNPIRIFSYYRSNLLNANCLRWQ